MVATHKRRKRTSFTPWDRFINFGLVVNNQRGKQCLSRIVDAINAGHNVSRNSQQHKALALLVLNAIHYDYDPLIISLDNNSYRVNTRYNSSGVGSAAFQSVWEALKREGLIRMRYAAFPGYTRSESSVIAICPTLKALCEPYQEQLRRYLQDNAEVIILRKTVKSKDEATGKVNKAKHPCEYKDDAFSNGARLFIKRYNAWIRTPSMYLEIPPERQAELFEGYTEEEILETLQACYNNRTLRRIFIAPGTHHPNDSQKPLAKLGGRFYGAFWIDNIPSETRPYLHIAGKPCVELDFRAMNVTMLYLMITGEAWTEYPYENIPLPGHPDKLFPKAVVKPFFTWCINNNSRIEALATLRSKLCKELNSNPETKPYTTFMQDNKINYNQLIGAVLDKHPAIRHRFFDGTVIGKELQYHDSAIAEEIMKACMKKGIYCCPVHDAFIVQAEHEDFMKELMVRKLCDHFGAKVKKEYLSDSVRSLIK